MFLLGWPARGQTDEARRCGLPPNRRFGGIPSLFQGMLDAGEGNKLVIDTDPNVAGEDVSHLLSLSLLSACRHPARRPAVSGLHSKLLRRRGLLAERGLDVSYETVRSWVVKSGPIIA